MVITEFYRVREDGVNLYRTYSDQNLRIQQEQTGAIYDEAVDVENRGYTYIETDIPIQQPEEEIDPQEAVQAVHILLGHNQ